MFKRYLNDVYELQNYKDKFKLKIEDNLEKKEKKRSLPKEASNYQSYISLVGEFRVLPLVKRQALCFLMFCKY